MYIELNKLFKLIPLNEDLIKDIGILYVGHFNATDPGDTFRRLAFELKDEIYTALIEQGVDIQITSIYEGNILINTSRKEIIYYHTTYHIDKLIVEKYRITDFDVQYELYAI